MKRYLLLWVLIGCDDPGRPVVTNQEPIDLTAFNNSVDELIDEYWHICLENAVALADVELPICMAQFPNIPGYCSGLYNQTIQEKLAEFNYSATNAGNGATECLLSGGYPAYCLWGAESLLDLAAANCGL